mgnify:CR=1 FL=1
MLVTEVGIDTAANELHPLKALSPMLVTEVGIDTAAAATFSTVAYPPHPLPMVVLPSGLLKCLFGTELHQSKAHN